MLNPDNELIFSKTNSNNNNDDPYTNKIDARDDHHRFQHNITTPILYPSQTVPDNQTRQKIIYRSCCRGVIAQVSITI